MRLRGKYYDSIHTCTLFAWNEAIRNNNLKALHISGRYQEKKVDQCFRKIFDEYLAEFGLPKGYELYLKTMVWAIDELARSYNGEKHLRPIAQIREAEAKAMLQGPDQKLSETLAIVSKSMGFRVDPKNITVAEFYGYVKSLNGK